MSDLSDSELRRLDLTLLLVFLGLLRHRKAALVATDLGLTQSAISQALKRLREIFDDDLFLRRPHGMEPTSTALALEEPITRAVESLRGALGDSRAFDPHTAQGVIRIAALDAEQAVLLPQLAAWLQRTAPGLRVAVLPLGRRAAVEALVDGRVDLAFGYIWDLPDVVLAERLYVEDFVVVGHDIALAGASGLSLDSYCAAPHILVSPAGDLRGIVDEKLETMDRSRRVILALPSFMPALAAAETTGALVTLPCRIAHRFAARFGLSVAAPPLAVRSFPVSVFWHRRNDRQPRTVWLKQLLRDLIAQTGLS
ncbi:LysR family transcriptional regulator [Yoonia vestfoldensis]|uniref:LysR family transcriptional regulator n=1 Tax=Yoonia vestfoldensis TaxID=245188 RepID=UPI00037E1DEA|nr:LysR family transcriptional regulator [Yoonia vestfoldensis]